MEITSIRHWGLLRCQPVWAYDRVLEDTPRRWHYTEYPTAAWFIRRGDLRLFYEDGAEEYGEGAWVFPRNAPAEQEFGKGCHIISIRFLAEWPDGRPLFSRDRSISFPHAQAPELMGAAEALVNAFSRQSHKIRFIHYSSSLQNYLKIQPTFFSWIALWYDSMLQSGCQLTFLNHWHEKLRQAVLQLENQPLSEPFQEKQLARQIGWSVSHLNKVFAKNVGRSPAALWNERRLNAAKSRLTSESESIKIISYELGFSSPASFTHWFRSHTGKAPRSYRQINRPPI